MDYVLKPFDPVVLRSKVAVFAELERHRRGRERADELLRRAWESSPAGVVLVDADGLVVRVNPALGRARRRRRAGVAARLAAHFHPRRPRGAHRAVPRRCSAGGETDSTELRLLPGATRCRSG